MTDILDNARVSDEEPKLIVRKASHAPIWSVWAVLEGTPSEEIFEGSSEEDASSWINRADDRGLKNAGENAMPSGRAEAQRAL